MAANYGISEGVCCRTGKAVYNKISCQSLRIFPAPPGFWEQEVNIPVRGTGPEARKRTEDIARGMMFGGPNFVSCRHPSCWICMGQKTHPTVAQIAAFIPLPSSLGRLPIGVLPGEEYLFDGRAHRTPLQEFTEGVWAEEDSRLVGHFVRFMRIVARGLRRYRDWSSRFGKTTIEIPRGDQ